MRVTEFQTFSLLANNLQRAQAQALVYQQQVSTGKQVTQPSDNPSAFNQIVQENASVALIQQRLRNINFGQTRLSLSDSALSDTTNLLTRAQQLAVQFSSDTSGASERLTGATEVRQLFAQLQQSANTDLNGQGIFTGTSTHGRATGLSINAPVTLTSGSNDTLTVNVDGVDSGTIDLTSGMETLTGQELASRLQSRINADPTLAHAGKTVTVTFDGDHVVIASDANGPSSQVAVTGGSSQNVLGFDGGGSTTGALPFALTATVSPSSGNTGGAVASQGRIVDANAATLDDYMVRFTSASSYDVLDVTVPVNASNNASNTGHASVVDAGIVQPQRLTLHNYQIQFTSATQYSVVDVTAGSTLSTGNTYVSGAPIVFDGLRVSVSNGPQGGPQAGDTFAVNLTPRTVLANQSYVSGNPITADGMSLTLSNGTGGPASGDLFSIVTGLQYQGDNGTQAIGVGSNQNVPTNLPGNQVFTSSTADIFATVKQLVCSLRTNDRIGITGALGGLGQSISQVSTMQGEAGALSNRLTNTTDQLNSANIFFTQALSQAEDVDLTKAISNMMLQQYAIQAASQTLSQVFNNSLLNYLK